MRKSFRKEEPPIIKQTLSKKYLLFNVTVRNPPGCWYGDVCWFLRILGMNAPIYTIIMSTSWINTHWSWQDEVEIKICILLAVIVSCARSHVEK